MGALQIHLLGRFEVARAGVPIPAAAWRRRRPADLLKLLALTPGRSLTRERVHDALWPGKDPASAANNLHRALYDLRQVLGEEAVDLAQGLVTLSPEAWVDAEAFEQAVRQGDLPRLREAVALYRGDLSPEDPESSWLAPHRLRLRGLFVEAAHPVAREAALAGHPGAAIPVLRRLLAVDPASEEAQLLLVRLLAEEGRRSEALQQLDASAAARRLARLGPPSPAAEALRDEIRRGEVGPAEDAGAQDGARRAARRLLGRDRPAPLRGREGLMAWLERLLDVGHGAVVLLGEPGAGATRVAVEAARLAQARGAAVLAGVAPEGPCVPGALFHDLLSAERRARPGLPFPASALGLPAPGGAPDQVRRQLFEAVRAALLAAAEQRPLFLLVDDLHAAGPTCLELLHALLREAAALRLVVVATCREDAVRTGSPLQRTLAHLDTARLARGLHVPRLSLAGTRELVGDLLETFPAEPLAAAIHAATDGRPEGVEAVVSAWRRTGLVPGDPRAAARGTALALPPPALGWLAAGAVLGRRFQPALAAAAAGLSPEQGEEAWAAVQVTGLVDEAEDALRFHGATARQVVLGELPPGRREALHAAAAQALEQAGTSQGGPGLHAALAWHRLRSDDPAMALPALLSAGHEAEALGCPAEAAALLEDALRLADQPGAALVEARRDALEALGRARLALGEAPALLRTAEAMAATLGGRPAPPDQRNRARRWAALARVGLGDVEQALALLDAGLDEEGGGEADEALPMLHLRAQLMWHARRFEEARLAAARCAAAGERTADADLAARGLDLEALAAGMLGLPPVCAAGQARPVDRRRQDRAPDHPFDVHLVLWERDLLCGWPPAELLRAARLHAERAAARHADDALGASRLGEGHALLLLGQCEQAERALRAACSLHRASGSGLGEALALERLASALAARGAHEEALALLSGGVVAAERGALRAHGLCRLQATLAEAWLAAGEPRAAEAAVLEGSGLLEPHGDCLVCQAALWRQRVRVGLALGRPAEADAAARELGGLAVRRGGALLAGVAARARAEVLGAGA